MGLFDILIMVETPRSFGKAAESMFSFLTQRSYRWTGSISYKIHVDCTRLSLSLFYHIVCLGFHLLLVQVMGH